MATSPPTRLDDDVYADAKAAAPLTSRSVAQQLSHWAAIGREVEAASIVARRRRSIAAVLDGEAAYDALPSDDQALVRAEWSDRIAERVAAVDIAAEHRRDGASYVALDDDGNVVRHHPDGSSAQL